MECPVLESAGHWVELGLSIETEISGGLLADDITWGWGVSGGPMSWTYLSHLRGSGLAPGQSTKTLSATRVEIHLLLIFACSLPVNRRHLSPAAFKTSCSLHLPARILKVYVEALTGFQSHIQCRWSEHSLSLFFFLGGAEILIDALISSWVIGVFRLSISSWFSLGRLYVSMFYTFLLGCPNCGHIAFHSILF